AGIDPTPARVRPGRSRIRRIGSSPRAAGAERASSVGGRASGNSNTDRTVPGEAAMITNPYTQALAWALVNFLWQGAAIGLVAGALWRFARLSASTNDGVGVALLAAMLAAPAMTFVYVPRSANDAGTQVRAGVPTEIRADGSTKVPGLVGTIDAPVANATSAGSTLRPFVLAGVHGTRLRGGARRS